MPPGYSPTVSRVFFWLWHLWGEFIGFAEILELVSERG